MDSKYFKRKLELVVRDIELYTKEELARELARLAKTADESVLLEPEFVPKSQLKLLNDIHGLSTVEIHTKGTPKLFVTVQTNLGLGCRKPFGNKHVWWIEEIGYLKSDDIRKVTHWYELPVISQGE